MRFDNRQRLTNRRAVYDEQTTNGLPWPTHGRFDSGQSVRAEIGARLALPIRRRSCSDAHAALRRVLEAAGAAPKLAEAIGATVGHSDADLAALEGHLTASTYRLAFAVVVAHAAIMFGLLTLVLPT